MKRYLLAHDLGTSGNKATLFTTEGSLVASVTSAYGTHYFNTNWSEQDPADWWRAVCDSTRALVRDVDVSEIAVICFSGQMMGCLCVDRSGRPLRPAILYSDQRSVQQCDALLQKVDAREFYRIVGHRASPSYSATKLMWVRDREPEVYGRTFKMLHAKDYLNFRLTGVMATEYSDASGTNLLDLNTLRWSDRLLAATGLDGEKLPALHASTDVVGELTREAAAELGLRPGIPVVAGGGDGVCAGVGVGSVAPGITYNYLGSSSWIATTTKEPIYDEQMRTFVWAHAVPGYVHPCGTMQTAGGAYAWLKNEVCTAEKAQAARTGENVYELINAQIASSPPGANGLVFLPYLLGERTPRWNPDAKGALIGLTLAHTRADILRAVMEGITINLSIILDIFRTRGPVDRITVIGGGAKGEVWRKIMADVYQAEVLRPNYLEEATSMGAAIIGGVGCGVFESFDVASRFISITDRADPDRSVAPLYARSKALLNESYESLAPLFPKFGRAG
ncbi:MAG TPA: xylulokinase [Spirochaetia bacterium]|nr:xylulokinase [Spirochaetia bacterium]